MTAHAQSLSGNVAIGSMRREQWLVVGNLLAALAAGALASWSAPMMLAILYIDVWLLANPHIVATYARLSAMASRPRMRQALVFVAPVLILAGLTIVALAYEVAGLFAVYFLAQSFHVSRQCYGIARRCDRRPQVPWRSLPYGLIYLFPAWGYLHRSAQGTDSFLGYPIWLPPVPQAWALAAGIAALVGAACWLACLAYSRRMRQAAGPFDSLVLSHLIVSLVGYVWIDDITIGWLVVNVWHNIQYLVFVYRQRQRDDTTGKEGGEMARSSAARATPWRAVLMPPMCFFLPCAIGGALLYLAASRIGESLLWLGLPTILIAHFVLNFHHYLVDSVIWKRRRTTIG